MRYLSMCMCVRACVSTREIDSGIFSGLRRKRPRSRARERLESDRWVQFAKTPAPCSAPYGKSHIFRPPCCCCCCSCRRSLYGNKVLKNYVCIYIYIYICIDGKIRYIYGIEKIGSCVQMFNLYIIYIVISYKS